MSAINSMSGAEKAATILNVLDKPLASRLLQLFSPEDLKTLSNITSKLQPVSPEKFGGLIEDFANQYSIGLRMLGDRREIGGLIETVLTPDQVLTLNSKDPVQQTASVWNDESLTDPEILEPLIEQEHPQVIAFILSKTGTDISTKMITMMSEEKRNDIMHRMLEIGTINTDVISVVEDHFRISVIENDSSAKGKEARSRIASIINNLDKVQADEFLDDLAVGDPEEAKELKKLLFSFEDIPLLSVKDRLVLFDNIETDVSILALNGTEGEIREMILSSFGTRARKMVESELANSQNQNPEDIDKARRKIASVALDLSSKGEITIALDEQDE